MTVLPRIFYLFQHLASRTVLQNAVATSARVNSSIPVVEPVSNTICRTIIQLLNFLPDDEPASKFIVSDLINLCSDLSVLATAYSISGNALFRHSLQVEILSQTIHASQLREGTEYLLSIPSFDMLLFLQAGVFSLLQDYLQQSAKKRLDEPITIYSMGSQNVIQGPILEHIEASFCCFDAEMLASFLASVRQVLTCFPGSFTDRKAQSLALKAKVAAGNVLLTLLEDWEQQNGGIPSGALAMQVRLLVVKAVEAWFIHETAHGSIARSSGNNSKMVNEENLLRSTLLHLVCRSILRPLPIQALKPPNDRVGDEGVLLITLVQCIPLLRRFDLLELVLLRTIHTLLSNNTDALGASVWSHCVSHGILENLFSLLYNNDNHKAIANVILSILDVLLSSETMVNIDRSCEMAWKLHQNASLVVEEANSINNDAATDAPASTPAIAEAATDSTAMECDTARAQESSFQGGDVPTPDGRKRRRTSVARASKNQVVQPLPLALKATPPKARPASPLGDADIRSFTPKTPQQEGASNHPEVDLGSSGRDKTERSSYSLDDALAHFLFVALESATDLLEFARGPKTSTPLQTPQSQNPGGSAKRPTMQVRFAAISSAICLLINALAKPMAFSSHDTVLQDCSSVLGVLVSLCNPLKELCRLLVVERNVGEHISLTNLMDCCSSIGLHAHFVLGQVRGTDLRLDVLRATLEIFSCLGIRYWLTPPISPEMDDKPTSVKGSCSESRFPSLCCGGICRALRKRVLVSDLTNCCTRDAALPCLCDICFCFLVNKPCTLPHVNDRFQRSCSVMLLQCLPLRAR